MALCALAQDEKYTGVRKLKIVEVYLSDIYADIFDRLKKTSIGLKKNQTIQEQIQRTMQNNLKPATFFH